MEYTFSPLNDFEPAGGGSLLPVRPRSAPPVAVPGPAPGLEDTFGPAERLAVFSAPGRTEIGGNHTDHQHGKVLAGSVNLDVIAAVAPSGDNTIRIQSEGFPMDVIDLADLSIREEEQELPPRPSSGASPPGSASGAAGWRDSTPIPPPASSRAAA